MTPFHLFDILSLYALGVVAGSTKAYAEGVKWRAWQRERDGE